MQYFHGLVGLVASILSSGHGFSGIEVLPWEQFAFS